MPEQSRAPHGRAHAWGAWPPPCACVLLNAFVPAGAACRTSRLPRPCPGNPHRAAVRACRIQRAPPRAVRPLAGRRCRKAVHPEVNSGLPRCCQGAGAGDRGRVGLAFLRRIQGSKVNRRSTSGSVRVVPAGSCYQARALAGRLQAANRALFAAPPSGPSGSCVSCRTGLHRACAASPLPRPPWATRRSRKWSCRRAGQASSRRITYQVRRVPHVQFLVARMTTTYVASSCTGLGRRALLCATSAAAPAHASPPYGCDLAADVCAPSCRGPACAAHQLLASQEAGFGPVHFGDCSQRGGHCGSGGAAPPATQRPSLCRGRDCAGRR